LSTPAFGPCVPKNPTVRQLRGRISAASRHHPEDTTALAALRAELFTEMTVDALADALATHGLSATQRHRISAAALEGIR